jgi:hypothetical protein
MMDLKQSSIKRGLVHALRTLAGVCVLCCIGSNVEETKVPAATYTNPAYGIGMSVPECDAKEGSYATLAIFYVTDKGVPLGNMNIGVSMVSTTRAEWLRKALTGIAAQGQKVNSQKMLEVSGRDAFIIDSQGKVEQQDWHFLSLFIIDAARVIVVTCTALPEKYNEALPQFQGFIRSVTLAK